jgi:broad specificity phosphatase PhoE
MEEQHPPATSSDGHDAKHETEPSSAELEEHSVLGSISDTTTAYTHVPEHGFSLFLANRTKTIHFIRHAEGYHNAVNRLAGNDTPVTYTTPGAWEYQDTKLTPNGIEQCVLVRKTWIHGMIHPDLIVVSPFTRTLQTAHILFSCHRIPFIVHDLCGERRGKFTCDKRRTKTEIMNELQPLYTYTNETIDFDSYGYPTEDDVLWTEERESDQHVTNRCIKMMEWLASRPEKDIAIVTHSSWLKHLFRSFSNQGIEPKDIEKLHRLSGNAEIRSVTLALHHGFYPDGTWEHMGPNVGTVFVPSDHKFRVGRYAPTTESVAHMHQRLGETSKTKTGSNINNPQQILKEHDSMPY